MRCIVAFYPGLYERDSPVAAAPRLIFFRTSGPPQLQLESQRRPPAGSTTITPHHNHLNLQHTSQIQVSHHALSPLQGSALPPKPGVRHAHLNDQVRKPRESQLSSSTDTSPRPTHVVSQCTNKPLSLIQNLSIHPANNHHTFHPPPPPALLLHSPLYANPPPTKPDFSDSLFPGDIGTVHSVHLIPASSPKPRVLGHGQSGR